ncbi:MAG: M20/M25/M40 family metallo-hydrolase [Anaerolineae bacterium]
MTHELTALLKDLSAAVGVSGYEQAIIDLLRARYAPYVDKFETDKMGNLLMFKRGAPPGDSAPRRTVMLAAHIDEIGAMVTQIDRGFLNITAVGGLDARMLLGQEVVVFGRQTYHGLIASRPPHFRGEDRSKVPPLSALQVDLGLDPETVAQNVRVGDVVAIKKSPVELLDGLLGGKAFDNRASVAALYVCLKELSRLAHQWDVVAVASCQEEVNGAGAATVAYRLKPDVAVAVDMTFADVPGVDEGNPTQLNKGPAPAIGANIHPVILKQLQDTAKTLEMPLQLEPLPANSGTDAWAMQTSHNGIPTALLSIPLRYMHAPVETISVNDVARAGRLLAHFIAGLSDDFAARLIPTDGLED